jgi:hypothetical protein
MPTVHETAQFGADIRSDRCVVACRRGYGHRRWRMGTILRPMQRGAEPGLARLAVLESPCGHRNVDRRETPDGMLAVASTREGSWTWRSAA